MVGRGHAWQILRDTVNKWAVRILLECIPVSDVILRVSMRTPNVTPSFFFTFVSIKCCDVIFNNILGLVGPFTLERVKGRRVLNRANVLQ